MERKTKEINLFGKKLLLSERNAIDVLELTEAIKKRNDIDTSDTSFFFYTAATVIQDALKINIENLSWYNFRKKSLFKKILTSKYLLENLSQKEIFEISSYVYELEGLDMTPKTEDNAEKKSQ